MKRNFVLFSVLITLGMILCSSCMMDGRVGNAPLGLYEYIGVTNPGTDPYLVNGHVYHLNRKGIFKNHNNPEEYAFYRLEKNGELFVYSAGSDESESGGPHGNWVYSKGQIILNNTLHFKRK